MKKTLTCLLLSAPAVATAADSQLYLHAESFSQSDPVSIHSFIRSWDGRRNPGSDAITRNWIEAGGCRSGFCVGLLQRFDYEIKASRDTADLYYQVRNHLELHTGSIYNLDLRVFGQRSQGLRLAYQWHPASSLAIGIGVSFLQGLSLTNGRLSGTAKVVGPKDYDYIAKVNYFYSKDALFDRSVSAPSGRGASLDWNLNWQLSPELSVLASMRDAYGFIAWKKAPYTSAVADSHVKSYDANGYVTYNPTITGFEGNASFRQRLHPDALAGADWQWNDRNASGVRYRMTEVRRYFSVRTEHRYDGCLSLSGELDLTSHAATLGSSCGPLRLAITADRPRLKYAQVLGLELGLSYPLD